jgi:mono/diheme cytochrome c family protein
MPSENPVPTSEASIRAGRGVYAKICRACHGLQGEGDGPSAPPSTMPANLVDEEWVHGGSDPEIFMTIKYGVEPYEAMEPWGQQLSDEDIWHTVNFLRDLAANAP